MDVPEVQTPARRATKSATKKAAPPSSTPKLKNDSVIANSTDGEDGDIFTDDLLRSLGLLIGPNSGLMHMAYGISPLPPRLSPLQEPATIDPRELSSTTFPASMESTIAVHRASSLADVMQTTEKQDVGVYKSDDAMSAPIDSDQHKSGSEDAEDDEDTETEDNNSGNDSDADVSKEDGGDDDEEKDDGETPPPPKSRRSLRTRNSSADYDITHHVIDDFLDDRQPRGKKRPSEDADPYVRRSSRRKTQQVNYNMKRHPQDHSLPFFGKKGQSKVENVSKTVAKKGKKMRVSAANTPSPEVVDNGTATSRSQQFRNQFPGGHTLAFNVSSSAFDAMA